MIRIHVRYEGGLRCTARHGPSGRELETDAPADNMGKGESSSPTDLVATALGTCMLTTMGILASRKGWILDGIELHVEKHMVKQPPRRIERLPVRFTVPEEIAVALDAAARQELEHAARTCPVALSLHPEVELTLQIDW